MLQYEPTTEVQFLQEIPTLDSIIPVENTGRTGRKYFTVETEQQLQNQLQITI